MQVLQHTFPSSTQLQKFPILELPFQNHYQPSVIIDSVDTIGVMNALTACWNIGFSLSMSAIVGENE